jgi:antirestriction protein ArdC
MTMNLYETITASILEQLESGATPWVKPWRSRGSAGGTMPRNAISGRAYSGVNVFLLWGAQESRGYVSPRWLTYKQAVEAGGNVRKGEKGTTVVFASSFEKTEEKNGEDETKRIPFLKAYSVFNVAQCDGLPEKLMAGEAVVPRSDNERDALAEEFVATTKADIREGMGEAYYRPSSDFISIPALPAFKSSDNYYATLFHEMGHWTGAKSRLARDFGKRFGDLAYAAEELVAEMTSAFLCAEFEFDGDIRHAGYIQHWIKLLKSDSRAFFTAAAKAQKAADHLRGLALSEVA